MKSVKYVGNLDNYSIICGITTRPVRNDVWHAVLRQVWVRVHNNLREHVNETDKSQEH